MQVQTIFSNQKRFLEKLLRQQPTSLCKTKGLLEACILLSGIAMLVGEIALLAGFKKKLAAIIPLVMLIPITLTVQLDNFTDLGPFFKNVAIAGSLLFIINYTLGNLVSTL